MKYLELRDTEPGACHHEQTENGDAKNVRMIFEDFIAGMSVADIAAKLNSMGVKSKSGRDWTYDAVRSILKNEAYVGDVIFFKYLRRNVITKEIEPGARHHEQTMNVCSDLLTSFLFCSIIRKIVYIFRMNQCSI